MSNQIQTIKSSLNRSMSYTTYRSLVVQLYEERKVTGPAFSESLLAYTTLNIQRMDKWDKHFHSKPEAAELMRVVEDDTWLVIAEGWCGDAAHILPVINSLAVQSQDLKFRIVLRDDNPELMNQFLTKGSRSIPILIRLNEELKVIGTWGPRPNAAQDVIDKAQAAGESHDTSIRDLQLWYSRDRGIEIEREIVEMLQRTMVVKEIRNQLL